MYCKKFPELKGVVWAPQEMKEVLKLPLQQQRKIREFYKANPYYKQSGILLLPKTIEKIKEIYTIYPEQKGKVLNEKEVKSLYRKARWINIQKEFNKIKNWQKETKQQDKFIKFLYKFILVRGFFLPIVNFV